MGRETFTKSLVAVDAEEDGDGVGRIRLFTIPDGSGQSLLGFVQQAVEAGSAVHTDGWEAYAGLSAIGFRHEVTNVNKSGKSAREVIPRVHRVASLLKWWLLGTHQGAVSSRHRAYYLDEFTFRFNRRTSRSRGRLFYRLVQQAAQVEPVYWADVAAGEKGRSHNR